MKCKAISNFVYGKGLHAHQGQVLDLEGKEASDLIAAGLVVGVDSKPEKVVEEAAKAVESKPEVLPMPKKKGKA